MKSLIIARLTFLEAARRRILLAAVVLGLAFLGVFALGFNYILRDFYSSYSGQPPLLIRDQIINFLAMAGLYVVNFLAIILSVLTSVDTLAGEISSGTIQTIITKPMRRWEVVFGKWLGYTGLLTLYILLMAGGLLAIISQRADYSIPNMWLGMTLIWVNGLLMLTVSLWGGAFLSTLANGVMVFGLFGVAFVGGWIEQIGSLLENQAAVNIGIVTSLLMPTEALWKRAAYEMQSPLVASLGFSPFTSGQSTPSPLMVWYAVAYIFFFLVMAVRIFSRRDI
jgi:ABC-type transport system involved in multi-copper enzyme maturation permease subunit